jgi:hypothetical protein
MSIANYDTERYLLLYPDDYVKKNPKSGKYHNTVVEVYADFSWYIGDDTIWVKMWDGEITVVHPDYIHPITGPVEPPAFCTCGADSTCMGLYGRKAFKREHAYYCDKK